MKHIFLILKLILIASFLLGTHGFASDIKLPVIDGKKTVATVDGDPITLKEFNKAIASSHAGRPGGQSPGRIDFSGMMKRLINIRLIVLEAKNMGLAELPEIVKPIEGYSRQTLRELLLETYVKDITVDEDGVKPIYQEMIKEWKLKSISFKKEEDAKRIEVELKAGKDFDEMVKKANEWDIAEADEKGQYVKGKDLTRPIAQLISKMAVGSISPIISAGKRKFIIFKLEGIRFPEKKDLRAWERARRQTLNQKKVAAARAYYSALKKKYVKLDQKRIDGLDFEAKEPGIEKLLKDRRILARIRGEKPITVSDLTKAIKKKFYHGIKLAIDSKRVNKAKAAILQAMLEKKILLKEALNKGIDKTDEYMTRVKANENSVIFSAFIRKVVTPDIKLNIEELKTYYKENVDQFIAPEMMRIKSLIFQKRDDAVAAIDTLKEGTDFNWLSAHADGQVDTDTKGLLTFGSRPVTVSSFPEKMQKAVSGAKPGEFKLYATPAGHFYVLYIYQIISPEPQPFEKVKKDIAKDIFNTKIKKAVETWTDKLREYYPVTIYRADLET